MRTPIRRTCIKNRRTKPRPGRLEGRELENLRDDCYQRDNRICQRCGKVTDIHLPQEYDDSFHMAHRRNKRMWGDSLENVQTECGSCHRKYHQNGPSMEKPCPPKQQLPHC
jgi:5-methylcytosine-specific restriction endonuclease McrA